jgi:hypothetical protein
MNKAMRLFCTLVLMSIISISPLSAVTVSFLVVETGVQRGIVQEFSQVWEDALMDAFFDSGHIVSNAPAVQLPLKSEKEFPDEVQPYLDGVGAGAFEYFILAILDYEKDGTLYKLKAISLKLYHVRPYTLLFEQHYAAGAGSARAELTRARQATKTVLNYVP